MGALSWDAVGKCSARRRFKVDPGHLIPKHYGLTQDLSVVSG
jgi:hypothetical protein